MPEKDVLFSISLPDGTKTTLNQEQYSQAQDKLFAKFPDAQVSRVQSYIADDEDANDTDSYHVQMPDGTSTVLDASQFASNRQKLQEKFPDAQIARVSDMTDRYWRPKLEEAQAALDSFNQEHGKSLSQYESYKMLAENSEKGEIPNFNSPSHQWLREHEAEYLPLKEQRDSLRKAIYGNPIVTRGRQQAHDNAMTLRERYLALAEQAETGAERRDYKRAAKLQGDAAELYAAPGEYDTVEGKNGFQKYLDDYKAGTVNTFSDRDFWYRGLPQIARDLDLHGIRKKVQQEEKRKGGALDERDFDRILTPSEKAELMSFYNLARAQSDDVIGRANDLSSAYRAGQGAAESLGFMAEFLLSQGLANVAGKALSGTSNAFAQWMGRALMSDKALARAVKNGVTTIPQMSKAAKVGTELARPIVQGLWHTGTQLSTLSNIATMMNQTNDEGELNSVGKGIWLGLTDSFVENWSESLGNTMDKGFDLGLEKLGNLGEKALGKTTFGRMARWALNTPFHQTLKEAGFNGFFGEMLEEWAGNAVRLATGLMDKDEFKQFASVEQQLEMAASFAPMSLFGLGGNIISTTRHNKEYKRLAEKSKSILMRNGVDQAAIDELFGTRFDTGEDVAKKLAPYAQKVLNSGSETAKEDYLTLLKLAEESGIQAFNEAVQEEKNQERRNEVQEAISAKAGQFWQDFDSPEAKETDGSPVQIHQVRVVQYADGTQKYIVRGENYGNGNRLYATVDKDGNNGYITDSEIALGLEEGTITSDRELLLQEYLQEQVDGIEKDVEAKRMEKDVRDQLAAVRQRIKQDPNFNMGTPEQPVLASVVPGTETPAGVTIVYGESGLQATITWKELAGYLGMPIEAKTDEQLNEEAAVAQQEAVERKEKYNTIPVGTHVTVVLPGAEGDEQVPYRFAKAIYDENDNTVRIYVADENGNILTDSNGEEVWFPEEMVVDLDTAAEQAQQPAATEEVEQAPVEETKAPAVQKYTNENGKVNQTAFFKNEPEEWAKWNDEKRQDGGANSKERLAASLGELNKEIDELTKKKAATANPDDAEALEEKLNELSARQAQLKAIYDAYIAQEQAVKAAEDEAKRAEFEADLAKKKAAEKKEAAKIQDDLKEDASFVELAQNYAEQPKTYGDTDTYNVGGRKFKGRWVVAEATTPKPSHNPLDDFAPTPGYPIGKAGNSNHYDKDKRAQEITREMSNPFDERAVQEPVVVTKHGIVLSGNGRTQARLLAAQQQTDADYKEYIREHASKWGLTAEQIDQYENPMLYFELEEDVEYTAALFDAFNRSTSKQQSVTETAAKVAQMTSDELVMRLDRLFREIGDNIDNLYKNPEKVNELLNMLQAAGIFNANERARFVDEYGNLSGAGEDLVESVLFGTIFSSSDESVRAAMNDKAIRRAVAFAFPTLVRLRNLNGEFSLAQELGEAVSLVAAAKAANGGKAENAIIDYMLQGDLFTGETPVVKATVQLLAHVLNDGKYGSLRSVLNQYIERAELANYGQANMFEGDVESKEQILRDVLAHNKINIETYGNQTESAGQSGVPANDEVRPAPGEQGSSQSGADAAGAADTEGVQGEGAPAAEGEQVDLLKVAKEQAAKNRLLKKLQKRISKWEKFLGKGAFEIANGIEDIEKIEDEATRQQVLERQQQHGDVEGWFANGKAVIYLPNIPDTRTLDRKIMHEVIAHKGIKGLFEAKGEGEFNKFLDWTWGNLMNDAARSYYLNYPGVAELKTLQQRQRAAADEFLAHCAEKETAVIAQVDEDFWSRLVEALRKFINDAMGEDVFKPEDDSWFADLLKDAAKSVQQETADQEEEGGTLFGIKETDTIPNEMEEGNVLFSVDGSMVGLHNISGRKLASAIRTGGLANPSLAVIDVDNMIHEDYGDISLVAPASLIDSETGRNAGTYNGDAWTPTYPGVSKQMSDKGWDKFYDETRALPDPFNIQVRNDWREYLEDDRMGRSLYWWFLQDTGKNPETVYNTSNLSEEDKETVRSFSGRRVFITKEEAEKAIDLFRRLGDEKEVANAQRKVEVKENRGSFTDWLRAKNEDIDTWGIWTVPVEDFVENLMRQVRYEGTIAEIATYQAAQDYIRDNNLDGEFQQWLQNKEKQFGTKEVLFSGWTPDGDRKYVPNTVENASRLMNREPDQNAYGNNGLSATRSLLLERMDTLEEIRKNRGQLSDIRGYASDTEEYKQASSNWLDVIESLANMQQISDNQFSNIDYAESRLQEAILEDNPIAHLNKEYGYNIRENGKFAKALKASVEEIKNLPAKYFETKFNRPVYLNEFAAAVIPTDTAEGVRKELEKAGLPIYEYDSKKEGSRQEAVLQASQVDGVRFSVGDYQSGEAQEQYRQQLENTPEFKEWFKGSKVVDENGNPLVVYRGSPFDPLAQEPGMGVIKPQAYFSPSKEYADRYARWGTTRAYYLNIQKPFDVRNKKDRELLMSMLPDWYVLPETTSGALDWATFAGTLDVDEFIEQHPEYDGAILDEGADPDGSGGVTSRGVSYIPLRGGAQVKSADANNGQFSPENPDVRFSVITPEQDAEYMKAVEDGDMEKARQMVDDAAKAAGYNMHAYHGTDQEFTTFKHRRAANGRIWGKGFYFAESEEEAARWGDRAARVNGGWKSNVIDAFLSVHNPVEVTSFDGSFVTGLPGEVVEQILPELDAEYDADILEAFNTGYLEDFDNSKTDRISEILEELGYDAVVGDYYGESHIKVFSPNQVKSAEPVTVDNDGKVIPLSQRFNEDNEDIRFSVRRYHNFATAQQENKVPGKVYPDVDDSEVRFSLSKNNRATVEAWLRKRQDLTDEQRKEVFNYIDNLETPTLQLATAKWFCQGAIRLPEDMDKVEQAVSVAGKAKVDPLQYSSPMELLDEHANFKASEKRINPDTVPTLHKSAEYPEQGLVVYDVDESDESRENMRKIINTHFGEDASPWCLLQGDGGGNLTAYSKQYWQHYNAYPKQVAFKDGKLLAFSANDHKQKVWWDRQDAPHGGIPIEAKLPNDELKRSATMEFNTDTKELGNPSNIHRGNKQNGTYELWSDEGTLIVRYNYKDGKMNGKGERWHRSTGKPWITEEMKNGRNVGDYYEWWDDGAPKVEAHFDQDGFREGDQKTWFEDGKLAKLETYKDGLLEGASIWWHSNGQMGSRIEHKNGKMDGLYERWYRDGKVAAKATYKNGELDGSSEEWWQNGNKLKETFYKNGLEVGLKKQWSESGNLIRTVTYNEKGEREGEEVEYYDFDGGPDGNGVRNPLYHVIHWKNGKKEGEEVFYRVDGKIERRCNWENGKVQGIFEQWHPNGFLNIRAEYKNGKRNGIIEMYSAMDGRLIGRALWEDDEIVENLPLHDEGETEVSGTLFSVVTDEKELERLNSQPTITLYRAMELIDGQLYPPMSQKIPNAKSEKGKKLQRREGVVPGMWQKSDEDPSKAYQKEEGGPWYYDLKKVKGSDVNGVLYNPYLHLSVSPLNDQFTSASTRPDLVVVACEVPISELSSGYKAEKANDTVGAKDWHSGTVTAQLGEGRQVVLSRWAKISRVLPDGEVAAMVAPKLLEKDIVVPANVVTPSLRAALEQRGVKFSEGEGIQGISSSIDEVNTAVSDYIAQQMGEVSPEEFSVVSMKVIGSRAKGAAKKDSDLDVLVEYTGTMREDDAFNALHDEENPLVINGVPVDINPIHEEETGTIEDWKRRQEKWAEEDGARFSINNRVFRAEERRPGESAEAYGMRIAYTYDNVYHKGAVGWEPRNGEGERGDMAYSRDTKKIVIFVKDKMPSVFEMEMLCFHESLHAWIDKLSEEDKKTLLDTYGVAPFAPEESRDNARDLIRGMEYEEEQVPEEYLTYTFSEAMSFGKVPSVLRAISDEGRTILDNILKSIDYDVEQETKRRVHAGADRVREADADELGERTGVRNALAQQGERGEEDSARFSVANRNQEIFVSTAERAANSIKMEKATPAQWLAMLEKSGGLKAGEDKWLGLSDWLKASDKKTITKQEILDFIDQNKIQIEETTYVNDLDTEKVFIEDVTDRIVHGKSLEELQAEVDELAESPQRYDAIGDDDSELDSYLMQAMQDEYGDDFELGFYINEGELDYNYDPYSFDREDFNEQFAGYQKIPEPTRLSYTTDGLTNKREIALTVPTIEPWNEGDKIHFGDAGEGRAIAWARFGDAKLPADKDAVNEAKEKHAKADDSFNSLVRELKKKYNVGTYGELLGVVTKEERDELRRLGDESGNTLNELDSLVSKGGGKVLFIDEIQSKRHQEAREQGGYKDDKPLKKAKARLEAATAKLDEFLLNVDKKYKDRSEEVKRADLFTDEERSEYKRLYEEFRDAQNSVSRNGFDPMDDDEYRRIKEEMDEHVNDEGFRNLMSAWSQLTDEYRAIRRQQNDGDSASRDEYDQLNKQAFDVISRRDNIDKMLRPYQEKTREIQIRLDERERELIEEFIKSHNSKIPAAPFEKNWHELAMKRMLRLAAEEGYDYVAWTTGDQQAERYNLSQVVSEIAVKAIRDGEYRVVIEDKYGSELPDYSGSGKIMNEKELAELVGKDLAAKLITGAEESRGKEWSGKGKNPEYYTVKGEELKVGGEGMKGFYDDILVRFVNKYAKKWNTSVKDDLVNLQGGALLEAHILPVTQEMKDSVMEGQVMFSVRAAEDARRDGIGAVIGPENVSDFYMELYRALPSAIRAEVTDRALASLNFTEATQEYISNLAARGNDGTGTLRMAEQTLAEYAGERLTDGAARYILWRGTNGVNENDLLDVAHDQFLWNYLKVDNPEEPNGPDDGPGKGTIERAREETDTNPTEAQKEAGNYKHGHVSIDGYNISLENPKGTVRSGKDDKGNEWSVTMNNDYGYIRMTEGLDGDQIDVFLSDNPEQGNVYVVDQVNPSTGEFDEHKVMYGFNTIDEAREAYLANYSDGWKGLGAINGVTKDEFKKWIESSTRKTKPFADYKSVRFSVGESVGDAEKAADAAIDEARERLKQDKKDLKDVLTAAKAMAAQKTYDKSTVEAVTNLAKRILKDQYIDALSRREVARLLGIVRTSVGKAPKTVKKNADAIVEMVIDNLLKREKQGLEALTKTTGTKTNATGVEVQGELDVQGQKTLKAFKEGLKQEIGDPSDDETMSTLYGLRARLADRLSSKDDATRKDAEAEDAGLALAIEYKEKVKSLLDEEKDLQDELKDLAADLKDGNISKSDYAESVRATEDAIRENRIDQVEAFRDFRHKMQQMLSGSAEARRSFVEREKARVEAIHHLANSDMQGRSADTEKKPTFADKLANSPLVQFFAAPLKTFDQMLRLFGDKNIAGEGYLWSKYMRGWQEASENAYIGQRDAKKRLDEKASEVFGDDMKWADLFDKERNMPTATIKWRGADGEMKEHELTQGQMLYIYMVNKMADGRMKLRKMGIDEDDVQEIKRNLDERFVKLADWLQEEFLVDLRNKYNAVHERLFGASMAAIDNYFPLVINKRDLNRNEDIAALDYESLPSTTTGSIIKRRRNSKALDLLNADAFSVILNHIDQMEQWAAFAEFNKDINALLSYKRFRNQVQNMASVYGSGNELWKNFKDVSRIAGNAYHPDIKRSSLDTAAVNLAKGVTSAKISFRAYTALKQFLSMPAFLADANVAQLAADMANPVGAWNWAMENLPLFEKRWKSRIAGDTRLMTTDMDWKVFRSKVYDKLSKLGMTPNAFVDAWTVAVGAHAIYKTKYNRYIKEGFSEEQADKKAKQDATVLYNETQQSNENAFLSPVQLDRTLFATAITVFRNSSMGFQRQLHDAVRNLGKMLTPGYKEQSIEFMTKQLEREGLSAEQAKDAAEKRYEKALMRNSIRVATFGFLVQFAWNLGGSLAYLLFGDDDDEKEEMLREAFVHGLIGGPIEGLAGGNVMSDALNMVAKGESLRKYDPTLLPVLSDMKRIYSMMGYDKVAAWNEVFNLATQALVGVNPQTFEDMVVAVIDACNGDPQTSKEAMLLIMRVLQVPQSQVDKIYIDELGMSAANAKRLSPQQMAKRYANYKLMRNAAEWTPAYSDELKAKRLNTYEKQFKNKVKERKELKNKK